MTDPLAKNPGIHWLLGSADPSVRYLTLTDILGFPADDPAVIAARNEIPEGPRARALLDGQQPDGGFGGHPYEYWSGTHWRLLGLAQLWFPPGDPRVSAAFENEWRGVVRPFVNGARTVDGRIRRHGCVEGNALVAAVRLGFADDPRVAALARGLIESQWPDGGWNNPENPKAKYSAVYETHEPIWGLTEYHLVTGDKTALEAARAAAECLLARHLIRSHRTGRPVQAEWTRLHYPLYWHYDVLQGLDLLRPLGLLGDPRAEAALDIVAAARNQRRSTWRHSGRPFWSLPGERPSSIDVVDWGRRGPNEFITVRALRVLKAAGRLEAG